MLQLRESSIYRSNPRNKLDPNSRWQKAALARLSDLDVVELGKEDHWNSADARMVNWRVGLDSDRHPVNGRRLLYDFLRHLFAGTVGLVEERFLYLRYFLFEARARLLREAGLLDVAMVEARRLLTGRGASLSGLVSALRFLTPRTSCTITVPIPLSAAVM